MSRTGGPEALRLVVEDLAEPGPGEVRVRVLVVGVSFGDVLLRLGAIPGQPKAPFTPGYDVVGVVDEVGAGVSTLESGQMVAALVDSGGYTEPVCLPAEKLVPVPGGLDVVEVAAVALNYFIAYQMLHLVAEGDKVSVRLTVRGAHEGVFQGIPPTGKKVTWAGISILRIADGKVAERWFQSDVLGLRQQLGAIPGPPPDRGG